MSTQEASEIKRELSKATPELSKTMKNLYETKPVLPDDISKSKINDVMDMYKYIMKFSLNMSDKSKVRELIERCKYIPSWILIKNYVQEFDPTVILSYIQNSNKRVMEKDISMLVKIGIEEGNDLEKIDMKLLPEVKDKFERLKMKYNLVSKAKNNKYAMTLSRIYESVPLTTCLYLKDEAKNPTVSFELMENICKNYPRVMMTTAFAYLIPNKDDEFCLFLKKAHLLHQYQFFDIISNHSHPSSSFDFEDELISKVYSNTQAAINGSHIEYDTQMKFLNTNNLIVEHESEVTVTEIVQDAVKLWDQKETEHELS